jgi:hypothetical protein
MMINKRFENWVKDMVGERQYLDLKETARDAYSQAMQAFDENIKPAFRGKDCRDQYVNFPMAKIKDDPAKRINGNTLTLGA